MKPTVTPLRAWTIAALLFLAGFINYFDRAIVSIALPVIGAELHLGPAAKGVLLSAFFWSYSLMQLPMGWFADRGNLRWLYSGAFALWSLACGFTAFASTLRALMMTPATLENTEAIYLPLLTNYVALVSQPNDRGLPAGAMICGARAGLPVGAPVIAALVGGVGWHGAVFALG